MILYVDYEHASTYLAPRADRLLAARTRISYMLQDVTGHRCLLQRYTDVDAGIVDEADIAAVFISGNGAASPSNSSATIGCSTAWIAGRCSATPTPGN